MINQTPGFSLCSTALMSHTSSHSNSKKTVNQLLNLCIHFSIGKSDSALYFSIGPKASGSFFRHSNLNFLYSSRLSSDKSSINLYHSGSCVSQVSSLVSQVCVFFIKCSCPYGILPDSNRQSNTSGILCIVWPQLHGIVISSI